MPEEQQSLCHRRGRRTDSRIQQARYATPFLVSHRSQTPCSHRIAELVTVQISPGCVAYRLVVHDAESLMAAARVVWMNQAFVDVPASQAACRARAKAWALTAGYRIVEGTEGQRKRA